MKLGILSDPRVAIVEVAAGYVLICHRWQHNKPLLEELCEDEGKQTTMRERFMSKLSSINFIMIRLN